MPFLYISYPVTPALSEDAIQERFIWLDDTTVAERLVGVEGGVVSVGVGVGIGREQEAVMPPLEPLHCHK